MDVLLRRRALTAAGGLSLDAVPISCLHCRQHITDITEAADLEQHADVALYQEADNLAESWAICRSCARFGVTRHTREPNP